MKDYVSELPMQIAILPGILLIFCLEKACQSLGEFSTGAERHLPQTVPWWKSTTDLRSQCLGDIVLRSQ